MVPVRRPPRRNPENAEREHALQKSSGHDRHAASGIVVPAVAMTRSDAPSAMARL